VDNLTVQGKTAVYLILAVILIVIIMWEDPETLRQVTILENEFKTIVVFPAAKQVDYGASHKYKTALVGAKYMTTANYSQIKQYYDGELKKHGWVYKEEKNRTTITGQTDPEYKFIYYYKKPYQLSINYWVQRPYLYYSIGLSWGLD
jgi:hypothetical protein